MQCREIMLFVVPNIARMEVSRLVCDTFLSCDGDLEETFVG